MLTRENVHGAAGFVITTVLIPIAFGLFFGTLEAFLITCVIFTAAWVVTHQSIHPKIAKLSSDLAIWIRRKPIVSSLAIGLLGATFGFVLFVLAAWVGLYLHKRTPLALDEKAKTDYEQVLANARESKKQQKLASVPPKSEAARTQAVPSTTEPTHKEMSIPQTIQVAPSFGNLRERCEALAQDVHILARQQEEKEKALGDRPSPEQQEQVLKLWRVNGNLFKVHYLERVLRMQQELDTLHIKDERLDRTLDLLQRNFAPSKDLGRESLGSMPVMLIDEIAERLHELAQKIPQ